MPKNNKLTTALHPTDDTMSVILARHCETTVNIRPDIIGGRSNHAELTPRGLRQAEQLGRWLLSQEVSLSSTYSSTALRAWQTARIALSAMNIDTQTVSRVDDILELSQGEAEGLQRTEVYTREVLAAIAEQGKDFKLPGGESMNEVGLRMNTWLDRLPKESGTHLVVAHGGSIKYLVSRLQGWDHSATYSQQMDNGSITVITRQLADETDEWNVVAINHPTASNEQ